MDESGTTSRHNGLHHHLTLEKVRRPFLAGPDSHVGLRFILAGIQFLPRFRTVAERYGLLGEQPSCTLAMRRPHADHTSMQLGSGRQMQDSTPGLARTSSASRNSRDQVRHEPGGLFRFPHIH
jgi:hypothetical protein